MAVITLRYFLIAVSYLTVAVVAMFIGVRISEPGAPSATSITPDRLHPTPPIALVASGAEVNEADQASRQLTFEDIDRQPSIFARQYLAHQLAAAADVRELIALTDRVIHSDDLFRSYNLATIFLERLLVIDVDAALDYVNRAPLSTRQQHQFLTHIYTSWIRHDPERAIDGFRNLTDLALKNTIGVQMLRDNTLSKSGLLAEIRAEMGQFGEQASESIRLQQMPAQQLFDEAMLMTGQDRQ